jgi:ribosomal protein S6--L-glutamate ligase
MRKYFKEVDEISLKHIEINFSGSTAEILYKGEPLPEYDCIYAKGSFRYAPLLQGITALREQSCFMPIESSAFSVVHDKLLTQLALQQHQIPMPRTYQAATQEAAKSIMKSMNFPIIMKFPQGTGGKGVVFAESYASASSVLDALTALRQPFIIQEYVETGGTDIRAIVIGDRVVAAMERKADLTEKRANIHSGGAGETIILDEKAKKMAVKVAKAIKADICGVDILVGAKGPVVIEGNISPGLQGITKCTKLDIANLIAEYLFKKTVELREGQHEKEAAKVMADTGLDESDTLITTLDFRGSKVLLPEVMVKKAKLEDEIDYEITSKPGSLVIKKFSMNGEE